MNSGIFSGELGRFYDEEFKSKPNPYNLHWSKRIGRFLPKPSEIWYEINESVIGKDLAQDTIDIIDQYVMPKLLLLLDNSELEALWLQDEDSQTTEFQRLLNLSVLLSKHKSSKIYQIIEDLHKYAERKRLSIGYHLNKLNARYANE